jgi:hypothetical protein
LVNTSTIQLLKHEGQGEKTLQILGPQNPTGNPPQTVNHESHTCVLVAVSLVVAVVEALRPSL